MPADRINAKMGEGQSGQKPVLVLLIWRNSQRRFLHAVLVDDVNRVCS
jgi:hypothetical protein